MARAKQGGDAFELTKDDLKGGTFKTAPGGTYFARITNRSKMVPARNGAGNNLKVHGIITKGPHKGITFFDDVAAHVSWKVGQLVNAAELKMTKGTLQQLLQKVTNVDLRVILREDEFQGRRRNKVVTWLPLKSALDEEEDEDEDEEEDDENDEDDEEEEEAEEEEEGEDEEEDDEEEDDEDEEEDEDEDEEEEEPKPAGRRRARKTPAKKTPAKRARRR